ncbi:interleukin-25-like [Cheilinus undulatus]|uniref:interleukin-25-like n=1 Tax=Cheilinus undulatus TaxID=241271 RepID=UPI001BD5EFC6|nr:interleukin-25-like [Cheilinus undulatus]
MAWASLQMLFLGSLLIHSALPVALRHSSCLTKEAFKDLSDKKEKLYAGQPSVPTEPWPRVTCKEAAGQMHGQRNNRALSPWTYRPNQDLSRIPSVIPFAYCLCDGCIIHGEEDHNYNSVMVNASLLVHRKTRCGNGKFRLTKELIPVPVACTCVVPNYSNHRK